MREPATDDPRTRLPGARPTARRFVASHAAELLCALLLAAMAVNMLTVIRYRKGITTDETLTILAGY